MVKIPVNLLKQSAYRPVVRSRASVLIIALWSLCLLATFAVMLGYNVIQKAALVKRLEERAKLGLIAEAGVRQAIALLQEPGKSYDSFTDPWSNNINAFKNVPLGEGVFNIEYEYTDWQSGRKQSNYGLIDEERKLNINKAQASVLERLFRFLLNCDEGLARDLAACVIDWRDSDSDLSMPLGGAEDHYYKNLDYPYEAKDADFEVLDELLLVKGFDQKSYEKVKDYITVYGSGYVNVNTADMPVFVALGLDEDIAANIIAFRLGSDGIAGTADDNFFETTYDVAAKMMSFASLSPSQIQQLDNIAGQNLTTKSNNFMIRCRANLEKRKYTTTVESIVDRTGKVLYWSQI
ncbi:MAG: hypothetical protein V2A59_02550 [Candidatus Omnitrophota bacterium]